MANSSPDYTGEEFGALTLVRKFKKGGRAWWECECECGERVERRQDTLLKPSLNNQSCGCKNQILFMGPSSYHWKGYGDLPHSYFNKLRHGAVRRGLSFEVDMPYLWDLYESQGRCCVLSGLPIAFTIKRPGKRANHTASLDRKDATLGYVVGNLYWTHKVVNQMRSHFDEDVFKMVCNAVATIHPAEIDLTVINSVLVARNFQRKSSVPEAA